MRLLLKSRAGRKKGSPRPGCRRMPPSIQIQPPTAHEVIDAPSTASAEPNLILTEEFTNTYVMEFPKPTSTRFHNHYYYFTFF